MNAFEARIEYNEDYIEFEQLIKACARKHINLYKTRNKSLNDIIIDLGKANTTKNMELPISEIKSQKQTRNWMAHSAKNAHVVGKHVINIKRIRNLNKLLNSI